MLVALLLLPGLAMAAPNLLKRSFPTCLAAPASCSPAANVTALDTCCTDSPGGYFLSTQFWDAVPGVGPATSWTIHGSWPDNCNGTYSAFCDPARQYTNITQIMQQGGGQATLDYMNVYWKDNAGNDESFWDHEWGKHGTCISTLDTTCYGPTYKPQEEVVAYMNRTVEIFKTLPTYQWLVAANITPSLTANYTLASLQAVSKANFGQEAFWGCTNGSLDQVWYGFTTQGPFAHGTVIPAATLSNSSCPATGIKWLPKVFAVLNSTSTTVAPIPSPTLKSSANSLVPGASVVLLSLGFSLVL